MTTPYEVGDVVTVGTWFGLGQIVEGVHYEYFTEDIRGTEVTITHVRDPECVNSVWYKIDGTPFTISHGMIEHK